MVCPTKAFFFSYAGAVSFAPGMSRVEFPSVYSTEAGPTIFVWNRDKSQLCREQCEARFFVLVDECFTVWFYMVLVESPGRVSASVGLL